MIRPACTILEFNRASWKIEFNSFVERTDVDCCGIMVRIVRTQSLTWLLLLHRIIPGQDVVFPTNGFERVGTANQQSSLCRFRHNSDVILTVLL